MTGGREMPGDGPAHHAKPEEGEFCHAASDKQDFRGAPDLSGQLLASLAGWMSMHHHRAVMAIHIRNRETDALVRSLARKYQMGLTAAVRLAVENELQRELPDIPVQVRIAGLTGEVLKRSRTGLDADKAFFDDLSGGL